MGTAITIFVILSIVLYLIIIASDESRRNNNLNSKEKESWTVMKLAKTNVKLFAKVCKLRTQLEAEKARRAITYSKYNSKTIDNFILKREVFDFASTILSYTHDIRVLSDWNISEEEKQQRINELTKAISKTSTQFIIKNELDKSRKHI
ncbi:MAG: hypothetical protein HFJ52_04200 [Clostridia bacterium]|nr:hypothetical protein [Clostridia bacterium]